jgi:hypothetical protein
MKNIFAVIAITAICSATHAQNSDKKFHFSVGPEVGFATGDFNNTHSVGIGATIQAENNIGGSTNITLTTGYMSYAGKSAGAGIKYKAAGIIPLKAGIKYFLSGGFYGLAQLGAGFFNNSGGTAFAYSPVIGYEFNTNSGKAIDASLKYDGYSKNNANLGSVGVRLAYKF